MSLFFTYSSFAIHILNLKSAFIFYNEFPLCSVVSHIFPLEHSWILFFYFRCS